MTQRPLAHQLLTVLPAILALILTLLAATPISGGMLTYTPNVAWLLTLVLIPFYPPAWPRSFAFFLGLLQDFLFHTPLGSQALLTLLLAQLVAMQSQRQQVQLFRMRWLEAAGMLVLWHLLLGALMLVIMPNSASLSALLRAGLINALWYPLFYWLTTRLFTTLPDKV